MKYKLIFFYLLTIIFSLPSICFSEPDSKEWEFFGVNNSGTSFYYNKTNISKSSNIKSVWVYTNVTDDERNERIKSVKTYDLEKSRQYINYDHNLMSLKIDCENRQIKPEMTIEYEYNGNILSSLPYKNPEWNSFPPNSMLDVLYKNICLREEKPYVETQRTEPIIPDSKVWEFIGNNSSGVYYYNKTNITKSSNITSVWTYCIVSDDRKKEMNEDVKKYKSDKFIEYQNYDHDTILNEIDCKKRKFRTTDVILYDYNGKVLDNHTYNNSEWNSIPPESILEGLYNKICITPKKSSKKK